MSAKTTNRPRTSPGPVGTSNNTSMSADNTKSPAPNAWSRPLKTRPPPGLAPPSAASAKASNKANAAPTTTNGASNPGLRERFLHLTLSLVGQKVTLSHVDGFVVEGVFHTFTPFEDQPADKRNQYVLKAVHVVSGETTIQNGSTVIVSADKVASLHCKSLRIGAANGGKNDGFRTDSEISSAMNGKGNELVAAGSHWTTVTAPSSGNLRAEALMGDRKGGHSSAPPTGGLRGNIGEWDQFRANEELFNVQAKFDENLYTTELDKSAIDRAKIKEAERIAREIESTLSSNIHVAEERNQVIQGDYDEEDKYSGVLTNNLQARNKDIPQQQPKKMNYAAAAAKADKQKAPTAIAKNGDEGTAKKKGEPEKKEEKKSEKTKTDKLVAETKKEEPAKEAMAEEQAPIESIKQETKQVANEKPQSSIEVTAKQEEAKGTGLQASVKKEKEETKEDSADKAESAKKEGGGIEDVSSLPKEETKDEAEEKPVSEEPKKIPSKLNANAKEFTFNPSAKAFTPGSFGGTVSPPVPMQEPQIMIEPNTGMPMIPNNMHGHPQYMHPMGQHGMMQMMNPHFVAAMRYPGYPGMEQHMGPGHPHLPQNMQQMQQLGHPQQVVPTQSQQPGQQGAEQTGQQQAQQEEQQGEQHGKQQGDQQGQQLGEQQETSTAPESSVSSVGEDDQQTSDTASQTAPPRQPQHGPHHGVPVPYPPGAYPYGGMPMPHRGPGVPHMAGYHPQMVGGLQQIPVMPGGTPYRPMYGMPQPPPQMRPNGAPYYPGAPPLHFSQYMMGEDDYRGGGRGVRGVGRGRGRGRKNGGRGGLRYFHGQRDHGSHSSGRQTPQDGALGDDSEGGEQYQGLPPPRNEEGPSPTP